MFYQKKKFFKFLASLSVQSIRKISKNICAIFKGWKLVRNTTKDNPKTEIAFLRLITSQRFYQKYMIEN